MTEQAKHSTIPALQKGLLSYVPASDVSVDKLASFFLSLQRNSDENYFHPHPLTTSEAENITMYTGNDLYFVQHIDAKICGYGILRGWDEGFLVPSLGIAIHPKYRGKGLGLKFMEFLHEQAKNKGAHKVRLTVTKSNVSAIKMYQKIGYVLNSHDENTLVGCIILQGKQRQ